MSARSFLDSNILIYTDDGGNPSKQKRALSLVERCFSEDQGVLSIQVLQEYFTIATRKLGVNELVARRKVELFSQLHLVLPGLDEVLAAIDMHCLHKFSFWDAMVICCALRASCSVLYSEDLQHGQRIRGLRIVNPFA